MVNSMEIQALDAYAVSILKNAWKEFLAILRGAIEGVCRDLELNSKYLATAEKKGKTPQQIANRIQKNERDLSELERFKAELLTYSKANEEIVAGNIKPHFIRKVNGDGSVLQVEAYYILMMPDGNVGYFDPYCEVMPMVRKFR